MASCLAVSVPKKHRETLDRNTVVMASCLTLLGPRLNRMVIILGSVLMVVASCITVSSPRKKS